MRFLDLFCCCGGISQGFKNIYPDAEIYGVDITNDHQYPFKFINKNVFDLDLDFIKSFDYIHASPPCQGYLWNNHKKDKHPRLIEKTRDLLLKTDRPYTIENVVGAPIRKDIILCGEMLGLKILRHRNFEIEGFSVLKPQHKKHTLSVMNGTAIPVYSGGVKPGFWNNKEKQKDFVKNRKKYSFKLEDWQKAMGINWVSNKKHLTQMIPPVYYEYILKNKLITIDLYAPQKR